MPGRAKKDGAPKAHETHPHFDGIWKDALTRWFPDCMRLLWPRTYVQVDWRIAPIFLDKEINSLRRIIKRDVLHVDHLAQVHLRDGKNALLLIHTEVQAGPIGSNLALRMLRYRIRLMEKHPDHAHFSCAILLDRERGGDTRTYQALMAGSELTFTFPVVNLAAWSERREELQQIAPNNSFAVVVLAQLACRATRQDEARLVSKLELAKLLKYWGYGSELRASLLIIIDSLLILPKALENTFYDALTQIEEPDTMHYISSIERIYWGRKIAETKDESRAAGRREGEQIGIAQILQAQLQQKFGPLPDWASDRIQRADTETLQRWAVNVLQAESLQSVFDH